LHPKWQFYAPNARIHLGKTVALINANFRLFRVPLDLAALRHRSRRPQSPPDRIPYPGYWPELAQGLHLGRSFLSGSHALDGRHHWRAIHEPPRVLERGEFRAKPFGTPRSAIPISASTTAACSIPMAPAAPQGGEQQRVEIHLCFAEAGGSSLITISSPRLLSAWLLLTASAKRQL